jgi:ribosomal protein L24E
MRTYDDTFSGEKIYPGKVRISYARDDRVAKNDRRAWQRKK